MSIREIVVVCGVLGGIIGTLGIEDVQLRLGKFGEFCHAAYWPVVIGLFIVFIALYLKLMGMGYF